MSAPTREAIVAAARGWIGTPYRHQASLKGVGCDCLGLLRGIWREVIGEEPAAPPPYRPDWAEVGGAETLLEAACRYLVPIAAPSSPRHAEERPVRAASRSTHDRGPSFETPAAQAPQDDAVGGFRLGLGDVGAGDVLLFRWRGHLPAKHCAILSEADSMIHAHDGAAVAEVALTPWWRRHLAGAFRFPGVEATEAFR